MSHQPVIQSKARAQAKPDSGWSFSFLIAAIAVIGGSMLWMNQNAGLDNDQALAKAQTAAHQYCGKQGLWRCGLELTSMDASFASSGSSELGWVFKFHSPQVGDLKVRVTDDGRAALTPIRPGQS